MEQKIKKLPEILNINEFKRLIENTHKEHHKISFQLAFFCGLRISEIVKLKKENIDNTRQMLFIKESKGNKDRYVPYPKRLSPRLKLIPINIGVRSLQIAFKSTLKRSNIKKDLTFHDLRHSFASYCHSQGMSLKDVQQILGHSNIATTSIYLHTSPEQIKNKLDEIFA